MTVQNRKWAGAAVTAGAFAVFLLVALHQLTHASLWVDESIEFWYSRVMSGPLPFEDTTGMVERINTTFQPPLYNFLMFFWLQVSTSQWWFRFFGVVAGLVGMAGLYQTVRRITGSVYASAASVLFASFVFQLIYYWQECAEYCLLLASLFWALYFWVSLLKEPSRKNIIGLSALSVVAVYSQYGAVFPVFIMLVTALVTVLKAREKRLTVTLVFSWAIAFVFAALPLIFFFLLPQYTRQHDGGTSEVVIRFYRDNPLLDFAGGAAAVFEWCCTPYLPKFATAALLGLFVLLAAFSLIRGSRFMKLLVLSNLCLWIIYYAALKLNIYAYGHFRGRYALFFLPCWLVLTAAMIHEVHGRLKNREVSGKPPLSRVWLGAVAVGCAVFCFFSWQLALKDNWEKEDNRTAAQVWLRENPEAKDTLVYYGASAGFSYYLYNDPAYNSVSHERIHYMSWHLRGLSPEQYAEYYDGLFGKDWPKEVYIVAQHISPDLKDMIRPFLDRGYVREDLNGQNDIRLTLAE